MNKKALLKEFIMYKWASSELTVDQIKHFIRNPETVSTEMQKKADGETVGLLQTVIDLYTKHIPALAFGVPLVAGFGAYAATHPDAIGRKAYNKTINRVSDEISEELGVPGSKVDDLMRARIIAQRSKKIGKL